MSVGGCGWKTAMFFPTSPCTARIARGAHNDAMQGSHDMAPTVNRYQPFTRKAASNQVSLFHIWSTIKTSTNNNPQIVPISGRVCLRASRIRQCGPHGWKKSEKVLMVLCLQHDHPNDICLKWSVLYTWPASGYCRKCWVNVPESTACKDDLGLMAMAMTWVWWLLGSCIALGSQNSREVWFEDLGLSACFFQRNNFSKAKRRWTYLKFKWSWFCL